MKFIIKRDIFLKNLSQASKIVPAKIVNAIFLNAKLVLTKDGLDIICSNSTLSIFNHIPTFMHGIQVIRDITEGSILVNAYYLTEIAKRITDDEFSFEIIDSSIAKIETSNSSFKLNTMRVEEYVDINFEKEGAKIIIPAKTLVETTNQVAFAASTKDTRPSLTAVNVESDTSKVIFTATDGARLAKRILDIQTLERVNANIPAKSLQEVVKSIENEENIEVYVGDKRVLFVLENTLISTTLINQEYPNTRNIIPKNFYYELNVNANELISAIERVSLFSSERENVVKLIMSEAKVEVSSKSQQIGSAIESISNFRFKGDRLEISFNSEYVKSAIKAYKSDDVVLSFLGEMKPFTVKDPNEEEIIQLITPVRTY